MKFLFAGLLLAGVFLLWKMSNALVVTSRYTFRNQSMQKKRTGALMAGIAGAVVLIWALVFLVGK